MSNMNEVKKPQKPIWIFYGITLAVILIFNLIVLPSLAELRVKEVDYGTFMTMTEEGNIGLVQIVETENYISFTDKEKTQVYKTGIVYDPGLTERLHKAGADFSGEIIEQPGIFSQLIFNWLLPIGAFFLIGQLISKHMMKKMGGDNSMMFNMGKSRAKVYVHSADGIKFSDVAGEDEAKESLTEIVDYLHNPKNMKRSAQRCQRDFSS